MPFGAFLQAVKDNAGGIVLAVVFGFGAVGLYYDISRSYKKREQDQVKLQMSKDLQSLELQIQSFHLQPERLPQEGDDQDSDEQAEEDVPPQLVSITV